MSLPDTASVQHPVISDPALLAAVKVSGFDINGLRVTYTAADDTLSVGIAQPSSQQTGHPGPVIAGDADNNGDDGTVNPAVTALEGPGFKDFADFGGSEFMGVFLDVKGKNFADVSAGYAINDPRTPKQYQVALAVPSSTSNPSPLDFGNGQVQQPGTMFVEAPTAEGNVYKVNSPAHPNLEFSIAHFSQVYLQETGKALTPQSVIGMGATAGSGDDPGIGEAFFPEQKFTLAQATLTPTTCPPVSPPVIINPHANQHINTAHDTLIRVNVLGSSGFDVSRIEANTVTLGGAHPVFSFDHFVNKDEWPDATFVFRGTDVHLPSGYTEATVAGQLTGGTSFSSSVRVFNRDSSFYPPTAVESAQSRVAARAGAGVVVAPNSPVAISGTTAALKKQAFAPGSANARVVNSTLKVDYGSSTGGVVVTQAVKNKAAAPAVKVDYTPKHLVPAARIAGNPVVGVKGWKQIQPSPQPVGKVVAIKHHKTPGSRLANRANASLDRYVRQVGAVNLSTGAAIGGATTTGPAVTPQKPATVTQGTGTGATRVDPGLVRHSGAINVGTGAAIGGATMSPATPVKKSATAAHPTGASRVAPGLVRRSGAVIVGSGAAIGPATGSRHTRAVVAHPRTKVTHRAAAVVSPKYVRQVGAVNLSTNMAI